MPSVAAKKPPVAAPRAIAAALLAYYDRHKRSLPWRARRDAYAIWISEIMLQQTRVDTVVPRWVAFLQRFPTIADLAAASVHDVCAQWAGLGYYSRARNLHKAAQQVVQHHGGQMPADAHALLQLAGIGRYTAGAIASIAYALPAPIVDGNVVRVLARVLALQEIYVPGPGGEVYWRWAEALVQAAAGLGAPGDLNQALMELGAMVCTPKQPDCALCPLQHMCQAHAQNLVAELPRRPQKKAPQAMAVAFAMLRTQAGLYLVRRPLEGLWAGLWEPPSAVGDDAAEKLRAQGWQLQHVVATFAHLLTHRRVAATVYVAGGRAPRQPTGEPQLRQIWAQPLQAPLSTLARKAILLAEPQAAVAST